MYVCSYLTVTSSVNITTRCVVEQCVAVTTCDPMTELIFRHAGSVELVTRWKFQETACIGKMKQNKAKKAQIGNKSVKLLLR